MVFHTPWSSPSQTFLSVLVILPIFTLKLTLFNNERSLTHGCYLTCWEYPACSVFIANFLTFIVLCFHICRTNLISLSVHSTATSTSMLMQITNVHCTSLIHLNVQWLSTWLCGIIPQLFSFAITSSIFNSDRIQVHVIWKTAFLMVLHFLKNTLEYSSKFYALYWSQSGQLSATN